MFLNLRDLPWQIEKAISDGKQKGGQAA